MRLGITAFLTDRDMRPGALARAVEDHGFDALYLPEHTHLPVRADVPPALVEGVRLEDYQRGLCPLVALSSAIETTTRLGLGTGILLAAQHDPIALAKQVATLDHLSGGRFTLGIGFGWNRAEAEDHGVDFSRRHALVREHLLCMQALWSQDQAEFHGEFIDLPPAWAWPKPVQQPRVRTLIGGGAGDAVLGAVAEYADGWMPIGGSGLGEAIPRLHRLAERAGRDPAELSVVPFGTIANQAKLEHYAGLGVDEVVLRLRAGPSDDMRAELEQLAALVDVAATMKPTSREG
jgi:probable F420-dependent oxidoreductase